MAPLEICRALAVLELGGDLRWGGARCGQGPGATGSSQRAGQEHRLITFCHFARWTDQRDGECLDATLGFRTRPNGATLPRLDPQARALIGGARPSRKMGRGAKGPGERGMVEGRADGRCQDLQEAAELWQPHQDPGCLGPSIWRLPNGNLAQ
ncbi:hypothetical protein N658DRAFT_548402 [Parathielavia hyrcaniae]|uniref:Uncharacterized protein n=1 Tax=Parathielavia hyrcaniae TaxID=113614 RepID=A0AAN6PTK5_9PEZI|nr:hypothetical protein N658DRAFT_548402 [Parathielavia hyrcaniae]